MTKEFHPFIPENFIKGVTSFLIGEAPGEQEEREGQPFVGKSGQFMWKTFSKVNLKRDNFYITNVFWERPPHNRIEYFFTPKNDEKACDEMPTFRNLYLKKDYLLHIERLYEEILSFKPPFIVVVGAVALWALTGYDQITKWRGTFIETKNFGYDLILFPVFHPSYVLRNQKTAIIFENDIKTIAYIVKQLYDK